MTDTLNGTLVEPSIGLGSRLRDAALQAYASHGVQEQILGLHFARHAKQVLDGLGVPLGYQEHEGGHRLSGATAGDFLQWLSLQLGQHAIPR